MAPHARRGPSGEAQAQELAAVPKTALGETVGSLASRRTELIAALDLLLTGV
ncbi:MAG TPA: CcdB family protein [Candidatus Acidoferrum sp.]|nr:CcdB family protein [Candidatus Acidoferrum sp.]